MLDLCVLECFVLAVCRPPNWSLCCVSVSVCWPSIVICALFIVCWSLCQTKHYTEWSRVFNFSLFSFVYRSQKHFHGLIDCECCRLIGLSWILFTHATTVKMTADYCNIQGPDLQNILWFIVRLSQLYSTVRSSFILWYAKDFLQESRKLICKYCLRRAYNFASESYLRRSIIIMALP